MGSSGLEGTVGVRNRASSIVVEMRLDVAADNTTKSSDEIVDLARSSAAEECQYLAPDLLIRLPLTQQCLQYQLC